MTDKNRDDRFIESPDTVEAVGYMGKDGKIHKELAPEDRMDMSSFYGTNDEAGNDEAE